MKSLRNNQRRESEARRGSTLVIALLGAIVLAGLAFGLVANGLGTERVREEHKSGLRAFYAAEAGLSDAWVQMSSGLIDPDDDLPATIGTAEDPMTLGPMSYWVEIEQVGQRSYALRSTGTNDGYQERLELMLSSQPTGFFRYACFGSEGVVLESNALIDSFDSTLGTYESQLDKESGFARENGDVGSNEDILLRSNTEVHGDCNPGPEGVVDDSAPGTYISGSTEPAKELFVLPPIEVPAIASSGSRTSNANLVLGPGEVHLTSLTMMGGTTLRIMGPATVVLDDLVLKSGASIVFDSAGGEIDLYGTGDFVLESNTNMTTLSDSAVDVTILLSGSNMGGKRDRLELSSNADFIGAIYAPDFTYKLRSNFDVYGSIICRQLTLSSNGEIHFDEALLYDDDGDEVNYDVVMWRELPRE